jgi:hypothetical protein
MGYLVADVGAATGAAYMLHSLVSSNDATLLTLRKCMDYRGFYTRRAEATNHGRERRDFHSANHSAVDKNMRSRHHTMGERKSDRTRVHRLALLLINRP